MTITLTANDAASLSGDIALIDGALSGSYTIVLGSDVLLGADLRGVNLHTGVTLTIDGQGHQIGGEGVYRGLFVYAGTVTVQNLIFSHTVARGGGGSYGGGGGAGLGGGLFVAAAGNVTLTAVNFAENSAVGGNGSRNFADGGGGGGMGGNGSGAEGGGGGGLGIGADGGITSSATDPAVPAGSSTILPGAGGGISRDLFALFERVGDGGGLGGIEPNFSDPTGGGAGGFGGGGGSFLKPEQLSLGRGGSGGFGGGGASAAIGGPGGFGGGGGGGGGLGGSQNAPSATQHARGGFGASDAIDYPQVDFSAGGGGLGAGADIFVQAGGTLTISGAGLIPAGTVFGGVGGQGADPGQGYGSGIFAQGDNTLNFAPGAGQVLTVAGVIADQSGSDTNGLFNKSGSAGVTQNGAGTLLLQATNTYVGSNTVNSGTLELATPTSGGKNTFNLAGGRLKLDWSGIIGVASFNSLASAIDVASQPATSAAITTRTRIVGGITITQHLLDITLADVSHDIFTLLTPPPASFVVLNDLGSGSLVMQSGTISLTSAEVAINLDLLETDVVNGSVASILLTDANPYIQVSPDQAIADTEALAAIATPFTQGTAALSLMSAALPAPLNVFTWNGGSGSAGAAGNWSSPTSKAVPGLNDEAEFGIGNGTITGLGAIQTLDIGNGAWTFSGVSGTAAGAVIGDATGANAALAVGTASNLSVGQLAIAAATDATGTAAVSGVGASIADAGVLTVGVSGQGSLSIQSGGAVSAASAEIGVASGSSDSSVSVTGKGSALQVGGGLIVGDGGNGQLSVTDGSSVNVGALSIAVQSSSGGSVSITGTSSAIGIIGALFVGQSGFGQLSISQTATVTADTVDAAAAAGSDGAIIVTGTGSALDIAGLLTVGGGSSGSLNIVNGASVTAGGLAIGTGASGSGNVVIGPGSRLTLTGTSINVGLAGSAVLDIQGGTLGLVSGTTLSPGTFGRIVQVGGLIDPATVFDASGGSFGGGGTAEASGTILNSSLAGITGGAETLLAPLATSSDPVNVAGVWSIKNGGSLVLNVNTFDNSQTIQFGDLTGVLTIGQQVTLDPSQTPVPIAASALDGFAAPIVGYKTGDKITFNGLTVADDSVTGGVVTLFDVEHNTLGSLTFQNSKGAPDNVAATAAAAQIKCFAAGTRIETADGPRAVETLREGDLVVLADGGCEPIDWIGQRGVDCARHPKPETVWPVRVAAGAFGENVPVRDLYLSPDHAVFINDVLVPVKLLINGTTIVQMRRDHVTYFHVELPRHAVILAEGLTVESYLDLGDRADFRCDSGVIHLHPDFTAQLAPDAAMVWETRGAAPLVMTGSRLAEARRVVMNNASWCRSRSARAASHAGRLSGAREFLRVL